MLRPNVTEGRWLSPDPLGGDITNPQSLNRYAYALNNPTTLTDPSGLCGECKLYEPPNLEGYDEFDFLFSTHPDGEGGFVTVLNPAGFAFVGNNFGLFHGSGTSIFGLPASLANSPSAAASTQTSACTVSNGRTTAPSPGQEGRLGAGPFGVPPTGSVAIDPWSLGLFAGRQTNALLAPYASQISFSFSPAPNLPPGFPTTHTLGSIVGPASVRAGGSRFNGLYDFDIFGLPDSAVGAATSPNGMPVSVTVTFPSSLPINCGGPLADPPLPSSAPLGSSPAAVAARAPRW